MAINSSVDSLAVTLKEILPVNASGNTSVCDFEALPEGKFSVHIKVENTNANGTLSLQGGNDNVGWNNLATLAVAAGTDTNESWDVETYLKYFRVGYTSTDSGEDQEAEVYVVVKH